jgi:hypothetical protein
VFAPKFIFFNITFAPKDVSFPLQNALMDLRFKCGTRRAGVECSRGELRATV